MVSPVVTDAGVLAYFLTIWQYIISELGVKSLLLTFQAL